MGATNLNYKNLYLDVDIEFDVQDFIENVEIEIKIIANIPNDKCNRKEIEKRQDILATIFIVLASK